MQVNTEFLESMNGAMIETDHANYFGESQS